MNYIRKAPRDAHRAKMISLGISDRSLRRDLQLPPPRKSMLVSVHCFDPLTSTVYDDL
jgi:hypothetical protein